MPVAYILYRRGSFQKVPEYDSFSYTDQTIRISYYRDSGWQPNLAPLIDDTTASPTSGTISVILGSQMPSTGNATIPDEQTHTPPRSLSWKETKLQFFNGSAQPVAEFYWKDLRSWSNTPPQAV